jgi:hypothetical protein
MLTFIALATLFQVLILAGVRRILQRNTVALRRLDTLLRQQRAGARDAFFTSAKSREIVTRPRHHTYSTVGVMRTPRRIPRAFTPNS